MILFTHIFGVDISCVHRLVNDPQDPNESSKNGTIQWFSFKNYVAQYPYAKDLM